MCKIRCDVAVRYLALEPVPNLNPSVQDLRKYIMPGTAVGECHRIYLEKLRPVLERNHELNPRRKHKFDSRAACVVIDKRIPLAGCRHPSGLFNFEISPISFETWHGPSPPIPSAQVRSRV